MFSDLDKESRSRKQIRTLFCLNHNLPAAGGEEGGLGNVDVNGYPMGPDKVHILNEVYFT